MSRSFILFIIFALITISANGESIKWYNYEKGMDASVSLKKPAIIDFYADWCPPCLEMENNTYPDPRVVSEMEDFILIKVNSDIRVDLTKKYYVEYFPTQVFLNKEGIEISRHIGYLGPEDMVRTIQESRGKMPKESPGFQILYPLILIGYICIFRLAKRKLKNGKD